MRARRPDREGHVESHGARIFCGYAERLTVAGSVDDALHAAVTALLPTRQLIELAVTVAAANFSNRVDSALNLDLERPQP